MLDLDKVRERVRSYGLVEMAAETGLTRQTLHRFVGGEDVKLSSFLKVLTALEMDLELSSEDFTDDDVLANLALWGAPLLAGDTRHRMTLEETLVQALRVLARDGRLTSVLAFLFVKKAYQVNWGEVLEKVSSSGEQQLLGYLLSLALNYRHRAPLKKAKLYLLKDKRNFQLRALSERDQGKSKKSFKRYENELAEEWKLLVRENPIDAVQRMKKWEKKDAAA